MTKTLSASAMLALALPAFFCYSVRADIVVHLSGSDDSRTRPQITVHTCSFQNGNLGTESFNMLIQKMATINNVWFPVDAMGGYYWAIYAGKDQFSAFDYFDQYCLDYTGTYH